jgi:Domain of unknown function (DUF4149)
MVVTLFLFLVAMACWLGGVVFFSFFTAPAIFGSLPVEEASKAISTIFPRYYMLGYIAGTVSLVLAIYFTSTRDDRLWWAGATLAIAIGLTLTFYAGIAILPRADAIRVASHGPSADPVQKAKFDQLHRTSVILNGSVLLLNLAALFGTAGALTVRG